MNRPRPARWLEPARALAAHPRLPDAASVVLVVLIGWQLAAITWAALPASEAGRMPEPAPIRAGGSEQASGADPNPAARLARLHLFGRPADGEDAGQSSGPANADAPETQLNLTLKGVYAPGDGEGVAIIAAGGGPEKVYSVGDEIAGNARISGIFDDRVVLRRNGRAETLRLDLADNGTTSADAGGSGVSPDAAAVREARRLRERLLDNPLQLARMVRFQPYRRNGELVGYRIRGRSGDAELLGELGIRPDDVITRINGIPLTDPANGNRALNELRDARMINVTVLRDGSSRQLSIPIGETG